MEYFHSVTLNKEKCKGCTNCIKHCPTEAIRVRDGKAVIINERCIDCGECIRRCPHQAKKAVTDEFSELHKYKIKVAIPAPTLYGQFKSDVTINQILTSLIGIGFDYVYEVASAAEIVSKIIKEKIQNEQLKKPIISSACPAIVRLIQVKFPELLNNIIPIESPMEVAARLIKEQLTEQLNENISQIGVFFISPCPAKVTSVKSPLGSKKSYVDGVISITAAYAKLITNIVQVEDSRNIQQATGRGIGWAITGGEAIALSLDNYLAVDGSEQVINVLEKLEMGKLADIDFFEGLACVGGCVGGSLTVENGFIAKQRIRLLRNKYLSKYNNTGFNLDGLAAKVQWTEPIVPREIMKLSEDRFEALKKLNQMEKISENLPGLDCGSCGAPTCRALAEDIIRGLGHEVDCIFKLREKLRDLAENMVELSNMVPPAIGRKDNYKD